MTTFQRYGMRGNYLRASELPSPAPAGHFLREFGQSDREVIGGAHTDATVPQALSLINGFVEQSLIPNARSYLMKNIAAASDPEDKVRAAFLSVLNRKPTPEELSLFVPDIRSNEKEAVGDLIWTLVNSNEFRFAQ